MIYFSILTRMKHMSTYSQREFHSIPIKRITGFNINPYRGDTFDEAMDINGDGVIDDYERQVYYNQSTEPTMKTYFITRDYENTLPLEFVNSSNDRYISFQYCRATCQHYLDGETEVHCSFVPRDEYCDSLVWYANLTPPDDNRKYEIISRKNTFKVWFTDAEGKEIKPDNFTLFLKLEY